MRIMSVFTSFGGLEKTGGFAQTIVMSNNPKVDDPWFVRLGPKHTPKTGMEFRRCKQHSRSSKILLGTSEVEWEICCGRD